MVCSRCGQDNKPGARYCHNCGLDLNTAAAVSEPGFPAGQNGLPALSGSKHNDEPGPAMLQGEHREIQVFRNKPVMYLYHLVFWLTTAVFAASAVLLLLAVVPYIMGERMATPEIRYTTVIMILVGLVFASQAGKYLTGKACILSKTVYSLLPGLLGGVILCQEGVYTMQRISDKRYYVLHPWASLYLKGVEAGKRRIRLLDGLSMLNIKASAWDLDDADCLERIQTITRAYLPGGRQTIPALRYWLNRVAMLVVIGFYVTGYGTVLSYLDSNSTGQPGDKHCDICGTSIVGFADPQGFQMIVNGICVHEYCVPHMFVYTLAHPLEVLEGMLGDLNAPDFLAVILYVLAMFVWLLGAFLLVKTVKWGAWTIKS